MAEGHRNSDNNEGARTDWRATLSERRAITRTLNWPHGAVTAPLRIIFEITVFFPDFAQGLRVCIWPMTGTA
jgi:hypothetical protein